MQQLLVTLDDDDFEITHDIDTELPYAEFKREIMPLLRQHRPEFTQCEFHYEVAVEKELEVAEAIEEDIDLTVNPTDSHDDLSL
jgi:hypothetical protein